VDAAVAAGKAGYKNVLIFLKGYREWTSRGYPVDK
jgi:rhodanese-related sulfurtransferase